MILEIHSFTPFKDVVKATLSFWSPSTSFSSPFSYGAAHAAYNVMEMMMGSSKITLSGFYIESFMSADSKTQYFLCNTKRVSITTDAENGINELYLSISHGICFSWRQCSRQLYSTYVHHFLVTTHMFWLRLLQHSVWTIFTTIAFPLQYDSTAAQQQYIHILQWELESRENLKSSWWSHWNCLNSWSCRVWCFSSFIQIKTSRILLRFYFESMTRISSSNVKRYGLTAGPSTIRLRAWRSTDWASPAVLKWLKCCNK